MKNLFVASFTLLALGRLRFTSSTTGGSDCLDHQQREREDHRMAADRPLAAQPSSMTFKTTVDLHQRSPSIQRPRRPSTMPAFRFPGRLRMASTFLRSTE